MLHCLRNDALSLIDPSKRKGFHASVTTLFNRSIINSGPIFIASLPWTLLL